MRRKWKEGRGDQWRERRHSSRGSNARTEEKMSRRESMLRAFLQFNHVEISFLGTKTHEQTLVASAGRYLCTYVSSVFKGQRSDLQVGIKLNDDFEGTIQLLPYLVKSFNSESAFAEKRNCNYFIAQFICLNFLTFT